MPEVKLLGWYVVEDDTPSRPQECAESKLLIVRGDLNETGFIPLLEPGVEDTTVSLLALEGVGLRSTNRDDTSITTCSTNKLAMELISQSAYNQSLKFLSGMAS